MANWDGRFKGNNKIKNDKWADAAKIMWAKINSSGRKPGYDRVTGKKDADAGGKILSGTGKIQAKRKQEESQGAE